MENRIYTEAEKLFTEEKVTVFLFGSKSEFDDLCYRTITRLKARHQEIKRIYVRAENYYINENYRKYLMNLYEDTYYPQSAVHAGRAVYVKRNLEMVDKSDFCIIYFKNNYLPKSGTKIAYEYAMKKGKKIINFGYF